MSGPDGVDRAAFTVETSFEAAAAADRAFWHARTPAERLAALEPLRRRAYGDAVDRGRSRVLEVVRVPWT